MFIQVDASSFRDRARLSGVAEVRVGGAFNRMLRATGRMYLPALKGETPKRRPAKLANSSRFQITGGPNDQRLEVRQGARSPGGHFYGFYVRSGTRPHVIRPVRAKALRFFVGGRPVFARRVNHPGTKPNPYHVRAYEQVEAPIRAEQQRILTQLARDLS